MSKQKLIQHLNIERSRHLDMVKALDDLIAIYETSLDTVILHDTHYHPYDRLRFKGPNRGRQLFTENEIYEVEDIKLDPLIQDWVIFIYDDKHVLRKYVTKEVGKRFKKINQHKITRYDN